MKNLPTILLVIILTLGTAITGRAWWNGHLESEALQKYNRQLKGELTAKEKEMQSLNLQLNVLNAELLSSESLKDDHDKILKALGLRDSEFAKFRKKHKLEIESYTETIFNLKRQITEGSNQTTVVVVNDDGTTEPFDPSKHLKPNQKINYEYKDVYGTVHLYDPDIATSGDEVLTLNQQFKIFGEIYRETNGNLKTQRLTLEEIHKTENGEVIVLRKLELDEEQAQFKYTIEPPASDDHFFEFNLIANVGYNFNDGVVYNAIPHENQLSIINTLGKV